ncbi:hypothetical protein GE300_13620 [Rhodobacteraceae bacterium 2CG4]|uniref:Sulfotransferase family protein n=1 Tax=Halovulum marinum TaxID=2662447 RepID=A0A6L5Z2Y5_9RHOB|nr:hypothetical protein [Halovulum marinum]MSU90639.1 hypothetical protein [Halovulum marinum]
MLPDPGRARRRLALLSARARRTLPGAGLRRGCLFVHLPKCGGTSLTAGLAGTVPLTRKLGAVDAIATRRAAALLAFGVDDPWLCHEELDHGAHSFALREGLALTHLAAGAPLVYGHVLVSELLLQAALRQGHGLVTMMRDPRARALSNYRMAVRAGVIPDDLDLWLDGPVGLRMGRQMLRYLSGHPDPARIDAPETALRIALERLERFALIGFLETPQPFLDGFAAAFGARPALPRLNRGGGVRLDLTAAQARKLETLIEPDRIIHARALALHPGTASARRARRALRSGPSGAPA